MKWKLNLESPLVSGMTAVFDLIVLNLLWILTSLPVITAGASTAALYRVVLDMHQHKHSSNLKRYFSAWKENWKQASILWIPSVAVFALFVYGVSVIGWTELPLKLPLCFALLLVLMVNAYGYAYLCFFQDTVATVLKNSLLLALRYLPRTALMIAINLLPFILLILSPDLFIICLIFWLMIGVALSAYINGKLILHAFAQILGARED